MLTKDIVEVKQNKKKYTMGYSPETLSYTHKVKDIYEAKDKGKNKDNSDDNDSTDREKKNKNKKKLRDPQYQKMINRAAVEYAYVDDANDQIIRMLQDRSFKDHEQNKKQTKDIESLRKEIGKLRDELHELKRTIKQHDHGKSRR